MIIKPSPNINGQKITVTGTATSLYSLINTAASMSATYAGYPPDTDGLDIIPEDGDIRVTWDGTTPTASLGELLSSGTLYRFRGRALANMKLIRVSGNVACSVVLGKSTMGESESATTYAVVLETGTTSTRTTVTPALTSGTLTAAGTTRKGLRVVHTATDPSQQIWITPGATATTSNYFTKLVGSSEVSLYDATEWPYLGQWSLISDSATGTTQVFELT